MRNLYKPDMQITRIRLWDNTSRLRPEHVAPKRGWAHLYGYFGLVRRRAAERTFRHTTTQRALVARILGIKDRNVRRWAVDGPRDQAAQDQVR
jgi:hypothetical protein